MQGTGEGCFLAGCPTPQPVVAKGLCASHYHQFRYRGWKISNRKVTTRSWSSPEVVEKVPGLTYRRLDHWCRIGLVVPMIEADGSGTHRRFSESDLRMIRIIVYLRRFGMNLKILNEVATGDDTTVPTQRGSAAD